MLVGVPFLHRVIACFGLVLALVLSVTPRQAFVLCIEADGCVSVAASLEREHCTDCEPHDDALAVSDTEGVDERATGDEPPCPCFDVEVPGTTEPKRAQVAASSPEMSSLVALAARAYAGEAPPPPSVSAPCSDSGVPRPPPLRDHVASVVLRV
ncbi:MAG: hypothetical protein IPJ77_05265 [Planctomycetes bacterium]|nr:hypothetical protein [Planctomycetota bacterium]